MIKAEGERSSDEPLLMKWYLYSTQDGESLFISSIRPIRAEYEKGWFFIGEL